tara:strand:- start:713 stop:3409 length:2697 start_codon:yes stop_codon:yes gene_type:complete
MASYLDNIPTFNEYREQLPVDDMLKVGLFKQQRYEEGVQKIQKSIDNIAGLDVVRDVDKKYLQSKLNSLGGQLQSVAASDFSNFQLVNTVDGMTNQLVKDPNILNAVGSAAKYRKQLENQEKINLDGKGSESNDWNFNKSVQQWYEGDIDASFNTQFKPYVNFNEQAMKIVKALASDSIEGDVYMEKDKNGRTVIYNVLTREKVEGISADKIQTALMAGLTPDAFNQMNIDGQYQYSNVSDDQFVNDINESYSNTFNTLLKERNSLESIMNDASTASEKIRIQNQIDQLDSQTNLLKNEYENVSGSFTEGDVESSKARLYSTNWMRDFSNSMSSKNVSQTVHSNPARADQLKVLQMQQDADQFNAKYLQTEKNNKIRNAIEARKAEAVEKANQEGYGGVPMPGGEEEDDVNVVAYAELDKDNSEALRDQYKEKYMKTHGKSEEELEDLLTNFKKSQGSAVASDLHSALSEIVKLEEDYTRKDEVITKLRKESLVLFPTPVELERLNKTITVNFDDTLNGQVIPSSLSIDYKAMDVMFEKFQKYVYSDTDGDDMPLPDSINQRSINIAQSELSGEELAVFNQIFVPGYDRGALYGVSSSSGSDVYDDWANSREPRVAMKDNLDEVRNEYLADELRLTSIVPQSVSYNIPLEDSKQQRIFAGTLEGLANEIQSLDEDKAENIRRISSKLISSNIITKGIGDNYRVTITGSTGSGNSVETETIDMTPELYSTVFGETYEPSPSIEYFNNNYLPSMLDTRPDLEEVTIINSAGNNETIYTRPEQDFWSTSTNMSYNTTPATAGLKGRRDFPNTRYFGVTGDLVTKKNPKDPNSVYYLKLNITNPITGKVTSNITLDVPFVKEKVATTLQKISDSDIYEILNGRGATMTDEYIANLKKAAESN